MACVSSSSCWLPASLTFRHLHSPSLPHTAISNGWEPPRPDSQHATPL